MENFTQHRSSTASSTIDNIQETKADPKTTTQHEPDKDDKNDEDVILKLSQLDKTRDLFLNDRRLRIIKYRAMVSTTMTRLGDRKIMNIADVEMIRRELSLQKFRILAPIESVRSEGEYTEKFRIVTDENKIINLIRRDMKKWRTMWQSTDPKMTNLANMLFAVVCKASADAKQPHPLYEELINKFQTLHSSIVDVDASYHLIHKEIIQPISANGARFFTLDHDNEWAELKIIDSAGYILIMHAIKHRLEEKLHQHVQGRSRKTYLKLGPSLHATHQCTVASQLPPQHLPVPQPQQQHHLNNQHLARSSTPCPEAPPIGMRILDTTAVVHSQGATTAPLPQAKDSADVKVPVTTAVPQQIACNLQGMDGASLSLSTGSSASEGTKEKTTPDHFTLPVSSRPQSRIRTLEEENYNLKHRMQNLANELDGKKQRLQEKVYEVASLQSLVKSLMDEKDTWDKIAKTRESRIGFLERKLSKGEATTSKLNAEGILAKQRILKNEAEVSALQRLVESLKEENMAFVAAIAKDQKDSTLCPGKVRRSWNERIRYRINPFVSWFTKLDAGKATDTKGLVPEEQRLEMSEAEDGTLRAQMETMVAERREDIKWLDEPSHAEAEKRNIDAINHSSEKALPAKKAKIAYAHV